MTSETPVAPRRYPWAIAALLGALAVTAQEPEAPGWLLVENSHFEVYGNAPEEVVLSLARDLENFRSVTAHVGAGVPPQDAVRTRIILFGSRDDSARFFPGEAIEAYTTGIEGRPYIVMAADEPSDWARATIRHEFVHVLQGYEGRRVPPWYLEGYAEFLSGIAIDETADRFVLGDPVERDRSRSRQVAWGELVSDRFRFDELGDASEASTAYYQAGLLVRYLCLADDSAFRDRLSDYLRRFDGGESSDAIFTAVFGESAKEIGSRAYRQRKPGRLTATYPLPGAERDLDFSRHDVSPVAARRLLRQLADANSGE